MFASLKVIFIPMSVCKNQSGFEWQPKRKQYRGSSPYANFISANFISANFISAYFISANLSSANFISANFIIANFIRGIYETFQIYFAYAFFGLF